MGDAGQSTAAPERSLGFAGSVIKGRYRVNALSSVSRDVVVYRAEDVRNGRMVALEVLRDELAGDPAFVAAVRDQARTLANSAHVHRGVARVFDCGAMDTGELFVALERYEGPTLREILDARGALDPSTALRIASQLGEALETLHHNRIIHGQLDPTSVLMVTDDHGSEHVTLVGVELTAAYRTTIGLRLRDAAPPPYLAPEQVEGGETSEASDVYALGRLLREMLTADKARSTTGAVPTPVVPATIERIIVTATEARPNERYPDISVMINDMWGAQTVLAEPESRPSSVKRAANASRRTRPRRPPSTLRIASVVGAAAIFVAVVVWATLAGRIVPIAPVRVTTPTATAVPVEKGAMPQSRVPSTPSAAAVGRATRVESDPVKDASTGGALARPVAEPRPAPPVVRKAPAPAPIGRRDVGDGSAIIDWLLKDRR